MEVTKQREEAENHLEIDVVELNTDTPLLVKGKLGNKEVVFAIDSGATVDCISSDFYQKHFSHLTLEKARHLSRFLSAGGDALQRLGRVALPVVLGSVKRNIYFSVLNNLTLNVILGLGYQVDVGLDIMNSRGFVIPYGGTPVPFSVKKKKETVIASVVPNPRPVALLYPQAVKIPPRSRRVVKLKVSEKMSKDTNYQGESDGYVMPVHRYCQDLVLQEGLVRMEGGESYVAISNPRFREV